MTTSRSHAAVQAAYDASGRPAGVVLYRWRAGWWVRTARGTYERLEGRKWREVVYELKVKR